MRKTVLFTTVLAILNWQATAAIKNLTVSPVPAREVQGGYAVDYDVLNKQMKSLSSYIDLNTGILVIRFNYPSQGWIISFGDKDGIIKQRNFESDFETYFEYPQRFLITLQDKYGQRVTQFETQEYFIPAKVIEDIKRFPSTNPSSQTPIEEYDGQLLKASGNTVKYQLNAQTIQLTSKISVCFNTNKVIRNDQYREPPYFTKNEQALLSGEEPKEEQQPTAAPATEGGIRITKAKPQKRIPQGLTVGFLLYDAEMRKVTATPQPEASRIRIAFDYPSQAWCICCDNGCRGPTDAPYWSAPTRLSLQLYDSAGLPLLRNKAYTTKKFLPAKAYGEVKKYPALAKDISTSDAICLLKENGNAVDFSVDSNVLPRVASACISFDAETVVHSSMLLSAPYSFNSSERKKLSAQKVAAKNIKIVK